MPERYKIQSTEPEFLIDTAAVNKRLAAQRADPRRWWTGTFRAPKECTRAQLQSTARESCNRFVQAMLKKGWDLIGKFYMYGPNTARDLESGAVLLDKNEFLVKAVFQMAETPKTVRLELPPGIVKRDPAHRITAAEARKVLA